MTGDVRIAGVIIAHHGMTTIGATRVPNRTGDAVAHRTRLDSAPLTGCWLAAGALAAGLTTLATLTAAAWLAPLPGLTTSTTLTGLAALLARLAGLPGLAVLRLLLTALALTLALLTLLSLLPRLLASLLSILSLLSLLTLLPALTPSQLLDLLAQLFHLRKRLLDGLALLVVAACEVVTLRFAITSRRA